MTFDGIDFQTMWRYKVASEAPVCRSIQVENTESPFWTDHWLPLGWVYVAPPDWKTLKGKNPRKCMMNLGVAIGQKQNRHKELER